MRLFSWTKPRIKRSLISLLAKYNSRNGVFAIEIKSSIGLGAKLEWCLEILAYCHDNGLVPQFKFSSNSSIIELNLGKDYDTILNIELAAYLIHKYLAVKQDVLSEVESFCHQHFANR